MSLKFRPAVTVIVNWPFLENYSRLTIVRAKYVTDRMPYRSFVRLMSTIK